MLDYKGRYPRTFVSAAAADAGDDNLAVGPDEDHLDAVYEARGYDIGEVGFIIDIKFAYVQFLL